MHVKDCCLFLADFFERFIVQITQFFLGFLNRILKPLPFFRLAQTGFLCDGGGRFFVDPQRPDRDTVQN